MWAWYLEWAEIARATIKERALLRRLGFLASSPSASKGSPASERDDEADELPAAATAPSPA